ncbi:hypothetical protein [Kinneretia aquatilis]|uniref:hypothetical protein n=1 Tax=Kinneretia aquatilis TaxID=2070761 RepID=UPI0014952851|nr:hypothetical protein [Paucibacter aquatile]WIV95781.1 hypothetical protein K9V56_012005 [Paucibacter aquatile]
MIPSVESFLGKDERNRLAAALFPLASDWHRNVVTVKLMQPVSDPAMPLIRG